MESAWIHRVRSFNRTVTERVGALNDRFLGLDRPVGEARLLWEIGPGGAEIRDLRIRLSLDSAYLSRLLRSLERQRLVEIVEHSRDRRVRRAMLTDAGRTERAELDPPNRSKSLSQGDRGSASILASTWSGIGRTRKFRVADAQRTMPAPSTSTDAESAMSCPSCPLGCRSPYASITRKSGSERIG